VRKFASEILSTPSTALQYPGNPLLDFQISNFLDRFSFKKAKKQDKAGL
jgi:hypothetical protein